MITYNHEYFEELEIEHDFNTYYANGYIDYTTTACIGSNYEGYDYEILYDNEISDITFTQLWYYDKDADENVSILDNPDYWEVEEIAIEEIRYKFE